MSDRPPAAPHASAPEIPLPALNQDNTAFWTGGASGQLLISRCQACRRWLHPPVPVCRHCLSTDVAPEPAAGTGTVRTFTINRRPWLPYPPTPYAVAVIDLDDDPELRLLARLTDADIDSVHIGMRVRVTFDNIKDIWIPLFTPQDSGR